MDGRTSPYLANMLWGYWIVAVSHKKKNIDLAALQLIFGMLGLSWIMIEIHLRR